ncbi:MAG TPA: hypothetical protein VID47_12680 [Actinomycetota bacterium]|jgi:hypothetical protein
MFAARIAGRAAMVALLACALAACQGQSRGSVPARPASHTTAPAPRPEVVRISRSAPIPPLGPGGRYLRQQPPGGARPTVTAGDAVRVALRHQEASGAGAVTAAFGLLRNRPAWFVTFGGVCKGYGVPPGIVGAPCQLNTETVVVNATTGGWELTYWGSVG